MNVDRSHVSPASSSTATPVADAPPGAGTAGGTAVHGLRAKVLSAVAETLGVSITQVQSHLALGTSLTEVATEEGISRVDLVATIKVALACSSLVAGTSLDATASHIADHGGRHPVPRVPASRRGPGAADATGAATL